MTFEDRFYKGSTCHSPLPPKTIFVPSRFLLYRYILYTSVAIYIFIYIYIYLYISIPLLRLDDRMEITIDDSRRIVVLTGTLAILLSVYCKFGVSSKNEKSTLIDLRYRINDVSFSFDKRQVDQWLGEFRCRRPDAERCSPKARTRGTTSTYDIVGDEKQVGGNRDWSAGTFEGGDQEATGEKQQKLYTRI